MRRVLFVTWDGPGQSYLPSLFFPIFAGLSRRGYTVDVLQHTWAEAADVEATRLGAERAGLHYAAHSVSPIWRRVGLPAIVAAGAVRVVRAARERRIDALFPRSLIPAAMALLARRLAPELRLIFDADGLMADERVDFTGLRPTSPAYRVLRDVEAQAVRSAAAVIARTSRAREILAARAGAGTSRDKIFVVPNGKDPALFAPGDRDRAARARAEQGVPATAPWLVYAGALGPQYFPGEMLRLFAEVRKRAPEARFTLFTRHAEAASALLGAGVPGAGVAAVAPERMPEVLAAADLGLALRATSFSQAAVSPIKVAEYLLCGTPVVASAVGDLAAQLAECPGALLVSEPSAGELARAAEWFASEVLADLGARRAACRARGLQHFALDRCVDGYAVAFEHAARA